MTPDERRAYRRAARIELARRPHLPGSLAAWCELGPPGELGPIRLRKWQRFACERMQAMSLAVVRREEPRLSLSVSAQEGKSMLAQRWLAWHMASFGQSVGIGCYGHDLAVRHSRATRELLRSPEAAVVWPHLKRSKADQDDDGAPLEDKEDDWSVPARTPDKRNPRFIARGVGGGLSGHTLMLLVIDDAFKDPTDYRSAARREQVREWYRSVVVRRVRAHGGGVANIGTRYGVNDQHGTMEQMAAAGADQVERINLPLRARDGDPAGRAPGEYISEGWTPEKEAKDRVVLGPHQAAAMLDGDPEPDGGQYLQDAWIDDHRYEGDPRRMRESADRGSVIAFVDTSRKTKDANDPTGVVVMGRFGGKVRILFSDEIRPHHLAQYLNDLKAGMQLDGIILEDADIAPEIERALKRAGVTGVGLQSIAGKGDKIARMQPHLALWFAGDIELPADAPWVFELRRQLLGVPAPGVPYNLWDATSLGLAWYADSAPQQIRRGGLRANR